MHKYQFKVYFADDEGPFKIPVTELTFEAEDMDHAAREISCTKEDLLFFRWLAKQRFRGIRFCLARFTPKELYHAIVAGDEYDCDVMTDDPGDWDEPEKTQLTEEELKSGKIVF